MRSPETVKIKIDIQFLLLHFLYLSIQQKILNPIQFQYINIFYMKITHVYFSVLAENSFVSRELLEEKELFIIIYWKGFVCINRKNR